MKTLLAIFVIALACVGFTGCAATMTNVSKGFEVEVNGGLQRRITFYSLDGKPIRVWEGKIIVNQSENNETEFIINGKKISINGMFTIEEI
jgi:hypothetical protein